MMMPLGQVGRAQKSRQTQASITDLPGSPLGATGKIAAETQSFAGSRVTPLPLGPALWAGMRGRGPAWGGLEDGPGCGRLHYLLEHMGACM